MPIFEYHCEDCGKDFESLVFGKEEPGCPFCNSEKVRKLMSTCGFVSNSTTISSDGSAQTVKTSASASPCSGCTASSCAGCSSH